MFKQEYVSLVDSMGDDLRVCSAARVSFAKESEWEIVDNLTRETPIKKLSDKDTKLINYLAKHGHISPFFHPMITLRIKMPIFVARQWFKHQIGITRNEVSRRYVDDEPDFYDTRLWRKRPENKKQGSSDTSFFSESELDTVGFMYSDAVRHCRDAYNSMISKGVAPEQARAVLPQGMFTEWVETGSLAAAARIAGLRNKEDAQKEVQDLAIMLKNEIEPIAPVSWKALTC